MENETLSDKICECGHTEKYHTGKDNWVKKSSSCHLCKCRKFKLAGKKLI